MRSFSELFVGRDDCYGSVTLPSGSSPSGEKLPGSSKTMREPVTQEIYDAHLAGEKSLGIVPIRQDGTCMWFAIDVDTYADPDLHKELLKKVYKHNLPLVMTKSKSGGAHLWCFFTHPCPAKDARDTAKKYLKKLGLPVATEIFPKQDKVSDVGSWINLPYFGDTRVCVTYDGTVDTISESPNVDDFLDYVDEIAVDPVDIAHNQAPDESDAPPCIDLMEEQGVEAGGRDNAVFHVAGYMKKAHPDDWRDKVGEWNSTHVHPPLTFTDVMRICASNETSDYGYSCDKAPMCDLCNKEKCLTRKYGIGTLTGEEFPFIIDSIRKIDSEVPVYFVAIEGVEFKVDSEDLLQYSRFKGAAFRRLNRVLPVVKQLDWEMHLGSLMITNFDNEVAPKISGETGIIVYILLQWLSQQGQSDSREKAVNNQMPWISDGMAYFRGADFLGKVKKQYPQLKPHQVWSALKSADDKCDDNNGLWTFSCPDIEVRKMGVGF